MGYTTSPLIHWVFRRWVSGYCVFTTRFGEQAIPKNARTRRTKTFELPTMEERIRTQLELLKQRQRVEREMQTPTQSHLAELKGLQVLQSG